MATIIKKYIFIIITSGDKVNYVTPNSSSELIVSLSHKFTIISVPTGILFSIHFSLNIGFNVFKWQRDL